MTADGSRGQSGFSLIEVLIAIAISGVLVGAIAGAMMTLNRVTAGAAKRQKVTAAMTSAAESIKAHDYVNCGHSVDYDDAVDGAELNAATLGVDAITISGVDFWTDEGVDGVGQIGYLGRDESGCADGAPVVLSGDDDDPAAPPPAATTSPVSPDQGAQLITIQVRLDDVILQSTVAKRRP